LIFGDIISLISIVENSVLTKILVTLLVIAGALFYIRKPSATREKETAAQLGQRMIMRYVLFGLVSVSLLASAGYWYWSWQDGAKIVEVTIVSPIAESSAVYQVYKRDIKADEITTVDGINIRLSNQERVIIASVPIR